jgi:hypothetical protein
MIREPEGLVLVENLVSLAEYHLSANKDVSFLLSPHTQFGLGDHGINVRSEKLSGS